MKFLISLFIWTISWTSIKAQNDCLPTNVNSVSNIYVSPDIDDTERGEIITLLVNDLTGVSLASTDNSHEYFDILPDLEENRVTVSLSEAFENIENDYASNSGAASIPLSITFTFTCSGSVPTANLIFLQTVRDTNNHDPVFGQSIYTYDVPVPFPPVVDISVLGIDIIATDIDISNSGITFQIEPSDILRIEYDGVVDTLNKQHRAAIYPIQTLELRTTQTFTITATDTGDTPRTSRAELVIQIDEPNSVEATPEFSQAYYRVPYDNSGEVHAATATITVTDAFTVSIETDYEEYFSLTFTAETGIANVQLTKNFDDATIEDRISIPIVITAVSESGTRSSQTVLVVEMPENEATPEFSETFYTAVYDNSDTAHAAQASITVTDAFAVTVETAYEDYFSVTFDPETEIAVIELIKNFDDTTIEARINDYIPVVITAVSESRTRSSRTVLMVKMPEREEAPEFTEAFYIAQYDNSGDTHEASADLTVTGASEVRVETGYQDYFSVSFTIETGTANVRLIRNFEDATIEANAGDSIPIVITAVSEAGARSSRTVLLVKIPETEPTPAFSDAYYIASYVNTGDIHEAEAVITVTDASEVSIETAYEDYFSVTFVSETETATVRLIRNFEEETIEDRAGASIPIVITAVSEFRTRSAQTVLIVEIPESEATPEFEEAFYNAVYDNSENPHVAQAVIRVTDAFAVSVETAYEDYFTVSFNTEAGIATVQLTSNFDDTTIEATAGNSIPILITAVSELGTRSSQTVLIVQMPENEATPEFEQAFYSAIYDNSVDTHVVEAVIRVTDASTVSVETAYEDYFEVEFNPETGTANIQLIKNVEDQIIEDKAGASIPIVITATSESGTRTSQTVLIVEMPEIEATPEFTEAFYRAVYDNSGDSHIASATITVTAASTVSVETTYEDYFRVTYTVETGTANVELIQNLDDATINARLGDYIPIVITAVSELGTKSTQTVLIVEMPDIEALPEFTEAYYSAIYDNSDVQHTAETSITVTGASAVTVETAYRDYFSVSFNPETGTALVQLIINFEDETITDRAGSSIPIVITAVSEFGGRSSQTVLIVQMPESQVTPDNEAIPEFAQAYYIAVYDNSGDAHAAAADITVSDAYDVSVETDYEGFFSVTFDPVTGIANIRLITNFDETTIETRAGESIPIVITAVSESGTRSTRTILLVQMPESEETPETAPEFAQAFYSAVYDNSGEPHTATAVITVTGASQVSVETAYEEYFDINFDSEAGAANIALTKNFDDATIEDRIGDSIPIVITALSVSGARSSQTVLILEMPEGETTPEFAEPYYNIIYDNSGDAHAANIIITDITGAFAINIETDYEEYFSVSLNSETGTAEVQLIQNFEDEAIEDRAGASIPIVITAVSEFGGRSAQTVLIVQMPESEGTPEDEATPEFAEAYYIVQYDNSGEPHTAETIISVTDASTVSVETAYEDYFSVTLNTEAGTANIQLIMNFDDTTIEDRIGDSIPIVITAISASGARSSQAVLILQMPEGETTPEFDQAYYSTEYDNSGDVHSAEAIIRVTGAFAVNIETAYEEYFDVTFNSETGTANVALIKNFEDETIADRAGASIPVVITAVSEFGGRSIQTVLIVQMPESEVIPEGEVTPEFGQAYYIALYDNSEDTHIAGASITVTDASSVSVEKAYEDYFSVSFDTETEITIQLIRNFDDTTIEDRAGNSIPIVLTAVSASGARSSQTVLIVQMPEEEATPEFAVAYYNVVYDNSEVDHVAGTVITVTGAFAFNVETAYEDYFDVSFNSETGTATVVLIRNFEDEVIEDNAGASIPIVITAVSEFGGRSSQTVLIVQMPDSEIAPEDEAIPEFAEAYYDVVYDNSDDTQHTAEVTITVTDAYTVSVETEYAEYFEITFDRVTGIGNVELIKNFDAAIIEARAGESIPIVITAVSESGTRSSRTILLVQMPESDGTPEPETAPEFNQAYYSAVYDNSGEPHTATAVITVTGASEVSVETAYGEYFDITFVSETGTANVALIKNFDDTTIEDRVGDSIPIVITALSVSGARSSQTVLILQMPEGETTPEFAEPYYNVIYDNSVDTHVADITITDITGASAINIETDYDDYFDVEFNSVNGIAVVQLIRNLEDEIIEEHAGNSLPVVLTAVSEFGGRSSQTVLIVQMPESEEAPAGEATPAFDQAYYNVNYDNSGSTHIAEVTVTVTDASQVIIETAYQEYFTVSFTAETGTANIELTNNFDETTIEERLGNSIPIVIRAVSASGTRSSQAVLLVLMPEDETTPEFSAAYYRVVYVNSEDTHVAETVITVTGASTVTVEAAYEEYFGVTLNSEAGTANVHLIQNFEEETIEQYAGASIPVVITAASEFGRRSSQTVLIVQIPESEVTPEGEATPQFSEAYYPVIYDNSGDTHAADVTITVTDAFTLSIETAYEEYFTITFDSETEAIIELIKNFDDTTIEERVGDSIPIVITAVSASGMRSSQAVLIVQMPEGETRPEFAEAYYNVVYDNSEETHVAQTIVAVTGASAVTVETDYEEYFTITINTEAGTATVQLTKNFDDAIIQDMAGSSVPIVITAVSEFGGRSAQTVLIVQMPEGEVTPEVEATPEFAEAYYIVDYDNSGEVHVAAVTITVTDASAVSVETDYEDYFSVTFDSVTGTANVQLITNFDATTIEERAGDSIPIVITAISESGSRSSRTILIVQMPEADSPPEPDPEITFGSDDFQFRMSATETLTGTTGALLSAISTIQETITYSSVGLPEELDYNLATGLLTNKELLETGIYTFTISARGETSGLDATASVTITVEATEICGDETLLTYSHFLRTIQEGVEQSDVAIIPLEESYSISFTVEPSEGEALFQVGPQGIICTALDREAAHFAEMSVAHYTIFVRIDDTADVEARSYTHDYRKSILGLTGSTRATYDQCVLVNNISSNQKQMTITLIVSDANDNNPVFSTSSMTIGYPLKYLLSSVTPQYLIQVEATDADIGENAELAYSVVDSDSRVIIHPSTGVIYPTETMIDEEEDFTFTVIATDQNGAGLSSNPLEIEVKFLDTEHISVITLENVYLEDLDEKIAELNAVANVNIQTLQSTVLPTDSFSRQSRADEIYYLTVISYALDRQDNLVASDDLKELLDNVENLSIETLDESGLLTIVSESSRAGWIAAVSVLSALLGLLIIGVLAFYFLVFRKSKPYEKMNDEQGSPPATTFKKNIQTARSSSKLTQDVEKPSRRPTGVILSGPVGGDSDDSPPQQRKSVVFNENVEQINVHMPPSNDDETIESSRL